MPLAANFFGNRFAVNGKIGHFVLVPRKLFQED